MELWRKSNTNSKGKINMSTPSEYKTKLLNKIEEIFEQRYERNISNDHFEDIMRKTIKEWKEFKTKSIVSQIHDLSL